MAWPSSRRPAPVLPFWGQVGRVGSGKHPEDLAEPSNPVGFALEADMAQNDDLVWQALQPALQLTSRVLTSEHPFFEAAIDPYCRGPIDPQIRRPGDDGSPLFNALQDGPRRLADMIMTWPGQAWLRKKGIDLKHIAREVLGKRLVLSLSDNANHRRLFFTPYRDLDIVYEDGTMHYGVTNIGYDNPFYHQFWDQSQPLPAEERGIMSTIRIELDIGMIWPLLVPEYTRQEKAAATMYVARTLLHEIAVSHPRVVGVVVLGGGQNSHSRSASTRATTPFPSPSPGHNAMNWGWRW